MSESADQASRERDLQRYTRTVFANTEGTGEALAEILGGANVTVAATLEEALASEAEVLVLCVDEWRQLELSPAQVDDLRARKVLATGDNADLLCRELDLDIGGGMLSGVEAVDILDATLLPAGEDAEKSMEPLAERPAHGASSCVRIGGISTGAQWRTNCDSSTARASSRCSWRCRKKTVGES